MDPLVRDLFHALADLSPAEREKLLNERRISPELRAEAQLRHERRAGREGQTVD
jgi:hypothetical protein